MVLPLVLVELQILELQSHPVQQVNKKGIFFNIYFSISYLMDFHYFDWLIF